MEEGRWVTGPALSLETKRGHLQEDDDFQIQGFRQELPAVVGQSNVLLNYGRSMSRYHDDKSVIVDT